MVLLVLEFAFLTGSLSLGQVLLFIRQRRIQVLVKEIQVLEAGLALDVLEVLFAFAAFVKRVLVAQQRVVVLLPQRSPPSLGVEFVLLVARRNLREVTHTWKSIARGVVVF